MHYYLNIQGSNIGPMTKEQVVAYNVTPDTPVSKDGSPWAPLYTYPELMQQYQVNKNNASGNSQIASQKTLCGIMAILFGTLGVQYFILGKVGGGIITILLSIVTCGLWGIVTLIQGIMMLCMSEEEFKMKYVDSTSTLPLF